MSSFSKRLLAWFDQHGRHDLPWQHDTTPYRVWVSEIMLQQTQVTTVIPYFRRFLEKFPSVDALAHAPLDEVLHLWTGLGYYARARNLHRSAYRIVNEYAGELPRDIDALQDLAGIGRSTAAAILSLSFNESHAILDGNVKRVLGRYHEIDGWVGKADVLKTYWRLAEKHTPQHDAAKYTQAIMDLGATVCVRRNPTCGECPLRQQCRAFAQGSQRDFPASKPKKVVPHKSTRFLIARASDGSTLLERRPLSGIWGGLWSFPELADEESLAQKCATLNLAMLGKPREHDGVRHTFTHFQLSITPIEIEVAPLSRVMDSDRWLWYNARAPQQIGLAQPVKKLLTGLTYRA